MKTILALAIAATALGGCAVVPYEPAPVVYAAPPPAIVVQPYGYYGYHGRWHRHWR
jgi:hypothetical protein